MRAAKENRRPPFTVAATRLMCTSFSTISLSRSSSGFRLRRSPRCSSLRAMIVSLEVQAGFARGVSQGLDPTVVQIAPTIEDDVLDALFDRALGHEGADLGGGVLVGPLHLGLLLAFQRRSRRECHAVLIIDDLGVDVLRRTEDRQARATVRHLLEVVTDALGAAKGGVTRRERHGLLLLAFFAPDLFARVAHALALVGLRRTDAADPGGGFANHLLVDARDLDLGLLRHDERDARRRGDVDIVA